MTAEPNPRLVAAMQRLAEGKARAPDGERCAASEGSSDAVAEGIREALDAIDELLVDPSLPRGTRINLVALRPVLGTLAGVTLRWEQLLSTAVVELRSPMGPEDMARWADAVAHLLPSEAERRALTERMVSQVEAAMGDLVRTTGGAVLAAVATVPKPSDHEAAAKRTEDAARRGATGAVQKEMALFATAVRTQNRKQMRWTAIISVAFVAGVLVGMWMTKGWVSYAIRESAQQMQVPTRR